MKKKNNKINIIIALSAVVILLILLIALIFGNDSASDKKICQLYFLNDSGTTLVEEEREIKHHNFSDLKENIVHQLIKGPKDTRNKAVIARKTDLIDIIEDENGNVIVNFTKDYISEDSTKNALGAYSVVKSLCFLEDVKSVKVVIEGEDLLNDAGVSLGYMSATDINLPTDTHTGETKNIVLYFPNKETGMLNKEERTVKVTDQQPVEQYIINELISGTENTQYNQALNKSTTLISVDTYGDLCFVNFKDDFLEKNSGSEEKERIAVYSVVNSLTELENIKRVQFLMDGKKVAKFGDLDIDNPFGRNSSAIE